MEALVVSANPTLRTYIEVTLEAEGFQPKSFANAKEALAYLREHTPDLIVLDDEVGDSLPPLDLAWRVKRVKRLRDVPLVYLASSSDSRTKIAAQMARIDEILVKPLTGGEFRRFARRTIEMRTQHS